MTPPPRSLRFAVGTSLLGASLSLAAAGCTGKSRGEPADAPKSDSGKPAGEQPEPDHINVGPEDPPPEPIHVNEGPQPQPEPPKPENVNVNPGPQDSPKPTPEELEPKRVNVRSPED